MMAEAIERPERSTETRTVDVRLVFAEGDDPEPEALDGLNACVDVVDDLLDEGVLQDAINEALADRGYDVSITSALSSDQGEDPPAIAETESAMRILEEEREQAVRRAHRLQTALEVLGKAIGRLLPDARSRGDVVEHAESIADQLDAYREEHHARSAETDYGRLVGMLSRTGENIVTRDNATYVEPLGLRLRFDSRGELEVVEHVEAVAELVLSAPASDRVLQLRSALPERPRLTEAQELVLRQLVDALPDYVEPPSGRDRGPWMRAVNGLVARGWAAKDRKWVRATEAGKARLAPEPIV